MNIPKYLKHIFSSRYLLHILRLTEKGTFFWCESRFVQHKTKQLCTLHLKFVELPDQLALSTMTEQGNLNAVILNINSEKGKSDHLSIY